MWRVSAFNFTFKDPGEQDMILIRWEKLLNSLGFPIQFCCESSVIDPASWVHPSDDLDYHTFIQDHVSRHNTVEKRFYVAIKASTSLELNSRATQVELYLRRLGLTLEEVLGQPSPEIQELRAEYVKVNDTYHTTLVVEDWPHGVTAGWLDELYNLDYNINIALHVHPQDRNVAINYLTKRITHRASTATILTENDSYQGEFEAQLSGAELMREELFRNQGKFFFVSGYITVNAPSLKELRDTVKTVTALLRGLVITCKQAWCRQDDGWYSTQAYGEDRLQAYYNFTTYALVNFLPFLSANVVERDGILLGKNLLNQGLIFVNHFAHPHASMVVLGKNGSGKSFTVKYQAHLLAKRGIKVTILTPEREYEALLRLNPSLQVVSYNRDLVRYREWLTRYLSEVEADYIHKRLRPRLLVVEEAWLFLQDPVLGKLLQDIAKTGRKRWLALCIVTQEVEDLLNNPDARSIINNTTFKLLFRMEYAQRDLVQRTFNLTTPEFNYLLGVAEGEGLLFVDNNHIQFQGLVSDDMYRHLTTKPGETSLRKGAKTYV